jgi:hypothetical protein
MEYVCDEMEELERKAEKGGKLSMAEIQYLDTLAHTKKNLLKADEMTGENEYSEYGRSYARGENRGGNRDGSYNRGFYDDGDMSMARGRRGNVRRDSMGRYSRGGDTEMMVEELRNLMEDAQDNETKQEFRKFIQKIESM